MFFAFKKSEKIIELKFDAPQDDPFTGWSVRPHMTPCRVSIQLHIGCTNCYFIAAPS